MCSTDGISSVVHRERLIDCSTEKAGRVQNGWDKYCSVVYRERLIDCSTEQAGSVQYGWD